MTGRSKIPSPMDSVWAERTSSTLKSKSELLGLVKGILSDGVVVEEEAEFLMRWIADNHAIRREWPGNVLFERLQLMLADRKLDAEEQRELLARLVDFVSLRAQAEQAASDIRRKPAKGAVSLASPYDHPPPAVEHMGRIFVVTGDFASMSRKMAERAIQQRGGTVNNAVSRRVHYVLIGGLGCEHWSSEGYGTKIERAVELRNEGVPIYLIAEEHWYSRLDG